MHSQGGTIIAITQSFAISMAPSGRAKQEDDAIS